LAPQRFYLPELDALRFFAFAAVFIDHLCLHFNAYPFIQHLGSHGVDLFFTLSAYLLTELMLREKETFGRLDIVRFYIRRGLRIWPLYFAFLLTVFIVVLATSIPGVPLVSLVTFAGFVADFPLSYPTSLIIVSLWSISLEEQFYLLWPWAVQKLSRDKIVVVAGTLWIGCALARVYVLASGRGLFWLTVLTHLDSLACGALLVGLPVKPRASFAIIGAASWALGTMYIYTPNPSPILMSLAFLFIGLGSGAFLLSVLDVQRFRHRTLVYLGRISYGLYVYHGPAIIISPLVSPAITFVLAAASYRYFESPFLRLKQHFERLPSRPI
jgi:peptidoglycan/LPS O-acetylase OafA/YrhL